MTHLDLIEIIQNFKERYTHPEISDLLMGYQNQNLNNEELHKAKNLLMEGIEIYQKTDDYLLSVYKISESLKIISSGAGFFNRGTIHWCEKNYVDCFKDQCSALVLERDNYPSVYFYLANSLYELANIYMQPVTDNEKYIYNFIVEILSEGQKRKDGNCIEMLTHILSTK